MTPFWQLGDAIGELSRLLSQSITLPRPRRREEKEEEAAYPPGRLVLIGGTALADDIVLEMLRLAGGRQARIALLPTASLDVSRGGERYARCFRRFGATAVERLLLATRQQAADPRWTEVLPEYDLIFLGGGDEALLLEVLAGTPAAAALAHAWEQGTVVAAIGAGASTLGEAVALPPGNGEGPGAGLRPGLGLLRGVLVDHSCPARSQWGRLLCLLGGAEEGKRAPLATLGIDDATALVVEDGVARVLGEGAVTFGIPRRGTAGGPAELLVHALPAGSRFDLAARRPLPALPDTNHGATGGAAQGA